MSGPAGPPLLRLAGVSKAFPGVQALEGLDLVLQAGEVHVVLGENGAGKSTLVELLAGLQRPDGGTLAVDGRPVALTSPARALALGIGTVFQHAHLASGLTVGENLALAPGPWWGRPETGGGARFAAAAAALEVAPDPAAPVAALSLGARQQVEIVRALMRGGRLLILDEPTAMLTPDAAAHLGALMRRLAAQGLAVLFITHKLDEALRFGDRLTVLRRGRKVGALAPAALQALGPAAASDAVIRLMFGSGAEARATPAGDVLLPFGEKVAEGRMRGGTGGQGFPSSALRAPSPARREKDIAGEGRRSSRASPEGGAPVLVAAGLAVADDAMPVAGLDFAVAAGEILGIAGIDGNGQKPLAEALAGQRPALAGTVWLDGQRLDGLGVAARQRRGLRYVTDDRLREGTVGTLSVALNLLLKRIGAPPCWRRGLARPAAIAAHARALVAAFDIRPPLPATPIGRLSGGNIQKALLARELSDRARAVIYAKPTHGLDLGNSAATRRRIREAAAAGVATLLISTDLDEVLALSDRIAVMAQGRLLATLPNGPGARERIGALMSGAAA